MVQPALATRLRCQAIVGIFICLAAAAGGCQRDIVPVSGRVTLNGKPLAGAVVTFQPRGNRDSPRPAGTGSIGHTDNQGQFSLRTVEPDRPGAVVGDHTVTISATAVGTVAAPTRGSPIPAMWRDGSRQFRVPRGGTTQANFDITESAPPPTKAKARRQR